VVGCLALEARNDAAENVCDAERRLGEILEEMPQTGERDPGKGGDRKSELRNATVKLSGTAQIRRSGFPA
jgi:hypothetical protein